jgi:hypothetical protein
VVLAAFKEATVQKMIWAIVAMLAVVGLGMAPAHAGVTCKIVASLCPPPPSGGSGGSHPVPEPISLAVLAAGAGAAGLAARRRRKK